MIRGTVTYTGHPDALRRELTAALKPGLQAMVDHWHSEIFPDHFERSAHQKYGYKNRKPSYVRLKLKRFNQANDLVYTGRLQREAVRSIRISGTSKAAHGVLPVPKYAYMYRKTRTGNQPDKAAELVAITEDEMQALAVLLDKRLGEDLNKNRETRTVTL